VQIPSESFRLEHPLFCLRLSFARLVHTYLALHDESLDMRRIAQRLDLLHSEVISLRDSIPIDWRPDNDIAAEPGEHICVLVLHLEYHTLLLMMSTRLESMAYFRPPQASQSLHRIHYQASGRVRNSRRILQTFDTIRKSQDLSPGLTCW
jgi:hypothetical protein